MIYTNAIFYFFVEKRLTSTLRKKHRVSRCITFGSNLLFGFSNTIF